jgi:putative ABC transport system permease protein
LREVLAEGMKPVLTGSVCGLAAASVGARMTASLLYGVGAFDVLSFLAAPGLLLLVALGACLVPARKATRVDPAIALHYE